MKKNITLLLAGMFVFLLAFSGNSFAKENTSKLEEVEIKTTAWHFEQQTKITDRLLEEEGIEDAWFDQETKVVTVQHYPDVITVDNIRFIIEDMGFETEIAENKKKKEAKYTSTDK